MPSPVPGTSQTPTVSVLLCKQPQQGGRAHQLDRRHSADESVLLWSHTDCGYKEERGTHDDPDTEREDLGGLDLEDSGFVC